MVQRRVDPAELVLVAVEGCIQARVGPGDADGVESGRGDGVQDGLVADAPQAGECCTRAAVGAVPTDRGDAHVAAGVVNDLTPRCAQKAGGQASPCLRRAPAVGRPHDDGWRIHVMVQRKSGHVSPQLTHCVRTSSLRNSVETAIMRMAKTKQQICHRDDHTRLEPLERLIQEEKIPTFADTKNSGTTSTACIFRMRGRQKASRVE
jgi:hypothetical protein